MMIRSGIHNYLLTLERNDAFIETLISGDETFYVIDANVYELYQAQFARVPQERLMRFDAVEQNKTVETALAICERMTALSGKRNARLVSFGGGITQDVTGFAANVLYRGIHWTFVPTTLLAACDSCIGGKTSLNYKGFKNLLGTFYPPERIFVWPGFFDTLTEGDFLSGLGEVVKFCLLMGERGESGLARDLPALLARDPDTVGLYTEQSLLFKKDYVERDEYDVGVRVHLNFAHTFGHAIETVSRFAIPHGTAVAMGMIVANRISCLRGLMLDETAQRMERILRRIIPEELIMRGNDIDALVAAIHNDKKQVDNGITAVLLDEEAHLSIVHDVSRDEIIAGYAHLAELQ